MVFVAGRIAAAIPVLALVLIMLARPAGLWPSPRKEQQMMTAESSA
jgi:hypothetical protein